MFWNILTPNINTKYKTETYLIDLLGLLTSYEIFFTFNFFFFFFFCFRGPHVQHIEVPRLGVNWSCSCRHTLQQQQGRIYSSQHCWILNPPSEPQDSTWILMGTIWVHYCWATRGTHEFIWNLNRNFPERNMQMKGPGEMGSRVKVENLKMKKWWVE